MTVSPASLGNLQGVAAKLEAAKNESSQNQKKLVEELFSGSFYNSGVSSKSTIENEIEKLDDQIYQYEKLTEEAYQQKRTLEAKVQDAQNELTQELAMVASESEIISQKQNDEMNKAVEKAFEKYASGEITEEEIPSTIAQMIASTNSQGSMRLNNLMASSDSKAAQVKALINTLTTLMTKIENLDNQLNSTKVSRGLLQVLSQKVGTPSKGAYANDNSSKLKPVYTPEKEELVTTLDNKYTGEYKSGDRYTMNNDSMKDLQDALGMNNNGTVSFLKQMKEQGFNYKEAMYASQFLFGATGIQYECGGKLKVPYGHDTTAKAVYNEFIGQMKDLFGKDADQVTDNTDPDQGNDNGGGNKPNPDPNPVLPPDRTDPIGFKNGNTTYDFALDRDGDNIFDGKEEFLGAKGGIEELKALDKDGNGKISKDEMKDLFVVQNNHKTGEIGFISAEMAGIEEIDLASIEKSNYTNVNGNVVENTFNMTVNGRTTEAYQSLDRNEYLDVAYGTSYGSDYTVKLDDTASKELFGLLNKKSAVTMDDVLKLTKQAEEAQKEIQETRKKVHQKEEVIAQTRADSINKGFVVEIERTDETTETKKKEEETKEQE